MSRPADLNLNRREWLSGVVLASGCLICGIDLIGCKSPALGEIGDPFAGGKLLGTANFVDEGDVPLDKPDGVDLDGRFRVDLSKLSTSDFVTPTEKFYIRTFASKLLNYRDPWMVGLSSSRRHSKIGVDELIRNSRSLGLHLMECAGNSRIGSFGLLSVANWSGIPLLDVLEQHFDLAMHQRVLVSGFDAYTNQSSTSIPGASWIFSWDDFRNSGAFLATEMNGNPLKPDHGAPIRLVVPGWYGCACIKWVNEIALVDEKIGITSQMQEFAVRTHQRGQPMLAGEYEPAVIDTAAMPIRVEKWVVNGRFKYRIVGIVWGGSKPVKNLRIELDQGSPVAIENVVRPSMESWGFWTHSWLPQNVGIHSIRMRIADPGVRTRRLDAGFYTRMVEIKES